MDGQLPQKVKARALQKRDEAPAAHRARGLARRRSGARLRALVDQPLIARGAADAPDIDGRILLQPPAPVGEFIDVRITGTQVYDLLGDPL